jgi:hypothetical protein
MGEQPACNAADTLAGETKGVDVYGPDRKKPIPRPKKKSPPKPPQESAWLAANRRKNRKKPIDKDSPMEAA